MRLIPSALFLLKKRKKWPNRGKSDNGSVKTTHFPFQMFTNPKKFINFAKSLSTQLLLR